MKYADGGIVSGAMFLDGDTGVELVGKLGTTNRGNSGELLPGIKAAFAPAPDSGKELVNQFAADIIKYFPEWNDKDIAEKKVELSFAYMLGKTEDIQRLKTEIETLTDKCRRATTMKEVFNACVNILAVEYLIKENNQEEYSKRINQVYKLSEDDMSALDFRLSLNMHIGNLGEMITQGDYEHQKKLLINYLDNAATIKYEKDGVIIRSILKCITCGGSSYVHDIQNKLYYCKQCKVIIKFPDGLSSDGSIIAAEDMAKIEKRVILCKEEAQ